MDGMMDHGNGHGMAASPPSSSSSSMGMPRKHRMMMHMSFYWGNEAEILFTGWPGSSTGMYVLSLFFVFLLAFLVEWISRTRVVNRVTDNNVVAGVLLTVLHAIRMGLAYFVMLAVMSFNVGIFIVAVVGHALGFLAFTSGVFGSGLDQEEEGRGYKSKVLPPMSC
ncbi:copper transporter 6-like [Silene latifolia]|uniref:copper transporter 6-like n=1 Tax=Silene latifolia TaxID=37657 RepID=UPI003D76B28C